MRWSANIALDLTSSTTGAALPLGGMPVTLIMQIELSNGRKAYSNLFKIKFRDVQLRYITVFKTFRSGRMPNLTDVFLLQDEGNLPS